MEYKVTAIHKVTIRAYVRFKEPVRMGEHILMKAPSERQEWISLRAGEVRDGLGLVLGVSPSSLPDKTPTHVMGVAMILLEGDSTTDLPKGIFLGLFRLECHENFPDKLPHGGQQKPLALWQCLISCPVNQTGVEM